MDQKEIPQEKYPLVFTAEEAAALLRISKCTLLRLANRGQIFGTKIGSQWRFPQAIILNALKHPEFIERQ